MAWNSELEVIVYIRAVCLWVTNEVVFGVLFIGNLSRRYIIMATWSFISVAVRHLVSVRGSVIRLEKNSCTVLSFF